MSLRSLSGNCYLLAKLSSGLTDEQQADGLEAAKAAGYTEAEINSLFRPIWSYQIGYWDEVQRMYQPSLDYPYYTGTGYDYGVATNGIGYREYPLTPTVMGDPVVWVASMGYGTNGFNDNIKNNNRVDSVILPVMNVTNRVEISGPDSIYAFIADYRAAQSLGDGGAANTIADAKLLWSSVNTGSPGLNKVYVNAHQFGHPYTPAAGNTYANQQWLVGPNEGTLFEFTRCSIIAQVIYTKVYGTTDANGLGWGAKEIDPVTQTDLFMKTRAIMGIQFWDFMHVDGNGRRVPAFVCPVPQMPPAPGYSLEMPPDVDTLQCDYTGVPTDWLPRPRSDYPLYPPFKGEPAGGGSVGGAGILIQPGRAMVPYKNYLGALVYDLPLKKWGKLKLDYQQLLDLSPINTNQGKIVTTQRFGMEAAAYRPDSLIYRFDSSPADSYMKYGKIGMHRIGFTTVEEVRISFRLPVTGTLTVSSSLDGRNPEAGLVKTADYTNATWCNMGVGAAGKWHTITIRGNYDIIHMEYVGLQQGRR